MTQTPALEMKEVVKEFPGVRALDGVNLRVMPGEIHALCGENGAGKSTLMKVLSGLYPSGTYSGEIRIRGEAVNFSNTRDSERNGIAIIYQELSLVSEMKIYENIFLGHEIQSRGWVNEVMMISKARKILGRVGLNVDPSLQVGHLGIGQQQLVEICKALARKPSILILDEPTSALSEAEVERLLEVLRTLKAEGVSSILITHKLQEVFAVADQITVLRDGKTITTHRASETHEREIISEMVGRELKELFPRREGRKIGAAPILEVQGLTVKGYTSAGRSRRILEDVSFEVYPGEILGVAGLMGSGRSELLLSLFGHAPGKKSGAIRFQGHEVDFQSPRDAIRAGLSLVTEDRKRLGLVLDQSVRENSSLQGLTEISNFGLVRKLQEFKTAQQYRSRLKIKTASLDTPVRTLSGGNQQKVVLAKCLLTSPKVLFLDEPTRGIDVGARAEFYDLIQSLAEHGMAIVLVSSELPEILGMSDRVLVIREGRLVLTMDAKDATQEKIMRAAALSEPALQEKPAS
jgi:D-xylose transport system ATP-binding protein